MKKSDDKEVSKKILKAAKKEFVEKGFNGARMGEIAKRAGVYKSHIHYYFENKEELYEVVINKSFGVNKKEVLTIVGGPWDLNPSQKLTALLYFMINLMSRVDDGDNIRLFFWEVVEGRKNHVTGIETFMMPLKNKLAAILKEGIERKDFEIEEINEIDYIAMSILNSITQYYLFNNIFQENEEYWKLYGNKKLEDRIDLMAAYLIKSLCPEGVKPSSPVLPDNLLNILDEIITVIEKKHEEGENIDFMNKLSEILSIQV